MCDDCMDRAYEELADAREKLDKMREYARASRDSGMDANPYDLLAILDGKTGD